jgi:hypothetical protein
MPYLVVLIIIVLVFYLIFVRNGKLIFWKIVSKNPERFLELIEDNDSWLIDKGASVIDKTIYDGPFRVHIPSLRKTIKVYGKIGKYEDSQKVIEQKLVLLNKIDRLSSK